MITWAAQTDKDSIFAIWKECFGDDDAYIEFFLKGLFRPERCLLYRVDTRPVAMLHLLPLNGRDGAEHFSAQYIYAAATLTEYRRRGLMAEMIDYAADFVESKGVTFTSLVPASDGLYDYYKKCGFQTAFYLEQSTIARSELEVLASQRLTLAEPNIDKILEQRKSFYNPSVLWGREMLDYIVQEWRFTGGELLSWDDGYAFVRDMGDTVLIKEACFEKDRLGHFANTLLERYVAEHFTFHLRQPVDGLPVGERKRCGMLRNHHPQTLPQDMYFNMMLD